MADPRSPVYINLHGGTPGGGNEEPEPLIRRCWEGRERLWIVFWAYGVFGCGVVIAGWLACIFIGLQGGLLVAPQDTHGGFAGAVTGIIIGALGAIPYLIWMTVSLWRCAPNCENKLWGRLVRGWLVAQYIGMGMVAHNISSKFNFENGYFHHLDEYGDDRLIR